VCLSVGGSCAMSNTVLSRSFVRNLESCSHGSSSVASIWTFCVVNAQRERIFLLPNHIANRYPRANKRPRRGLGVYIHPQVSRSRKQAHHCRPCLRNGYEYERVSRSCSQTCVYWSKRSEINKDRKQVIFAHLYISMNTDIHTTE